MLTNTASFDLAVGGVLMPFLIALINQSTWSPKLRGVVAFAACLGGAALLSWLHNDLSITTWRDTAILVTVAALGMYHALWRPTGLAPALESATTLWGTSANPAASPSIE